MDAEFMHPVPVMSGMVVAASTEDYTAYLQRKRELIRRACASGAGLIERLVGPPCADARELAATLFDLFTLEIDTELAQIAKGPPPPGPPPPGPMPGMDWSAAMVKAQEQVATWQERVEHLHQAIDQAPDNLKAIWEVSLLPPAEDALRNAESQRDYCQQMLEQQFPTP